MKCLAVNCEKIPEVFGNWGIFKLHYCKNHKKILKMFCNKPKTKTISKNDNVL